ncbi:succinate dehydrogenase, membrane subunit [Leifsonia xyli subsp. cynodontis DSM 46306]|uniref:Succinate dehydrogenase hydrophobic membrane anchor subunit n=1 Tax=Leifsonia xyli subsp. cynodontis DSM 46306 TaxID=1389489 RepID=U3P6V3_LEIXC|nr:succinate dehydrogenase hydrophobic membrane anchor subunit [Leifsonia xyli]AGW40657.1 succinate dehydrogenase, membrane subunit [Leifsonia xyli subsp. cynodontis DSM 46306]
MTTIETPRTPARTGTRRNNWEKWGWIYMRASGVLLVVLIFGHLLINLVLDDGVKQIDFAFVAGKYAAPFWQVWDLLMLWLALIHGGNGMRTLVNDYTVNATLNRILKWAIAAAVVVLIVLGTLVIFTFDPCPAGAAADQLSSFCPAK